MNDLLQGSFKIHSSEHIYYTIFSVIYQPDIRFSMKKGHRFSGNGVLYFTSKRSGLSIFLDYTYYIISVRYCQELIPFQCVFLFFPRPLRPLSICLLSQAVFPLLPSYPLQASRNQQVCLFHVSLYK